MCAHRHLPHAVAVPYPWLALPPYRLLLRGRATAEAQRTPRAALPAAPPHRPRRRPPRACSQASGVAVAGNYAYVTGRVKDYSLAVIAVSNPTSPTIVGSIASSTVQFEVRTPASPARRGRALSVAAPPAPKAAAARASEEGGGSRWR